MKNGMEKRIACLLVLGMACSLAAAPASADSPGKTPITITVEDEVRTYLQENPAAWSYRVTEGALAENDSVEDLVKGPPACAASSKSPAGEYPITLSKKEDLPGYDVTIENGTLTIEPATLTSFSSGEPYAAAYYQSIYANDPYNQSPGSLIRLLTEKKGSYLADSGGDGGVELKASWSADESNAAFDPKGQEKTEWGYIWYSYTAGLTARNRSEANNFQIKIESPKAYIRVIPVNATQTLPSDSATVTLAAVEALTNESAMKAALNLPKAAAVTYIPAEMAGPYEGEGEGAYAISGWTLDDGRRLTLKALRAIAAGVPDGGEASVTLTPVYAAGGDLAVPAWATLEEPPRFTLILTGKTPAAATVKAPDSITYGETLGDPVAELETGGAGTVSWNYVGVDGTRYDSPDKPTAAGSYRAVATLTSATHSGSWTSGAFTIRPRAVTVSGITGTAREYDGTTNANAALNPAKAVIRGRIGGDDLQVSASGYFVDKNVGRDKTVVIFNITLAGGDAGNYTLAASGNQTRTTAHITPRPLEIDDSGITVTKPYDGTKAAGTLEGTLKLQGVIHNEVRLSEAKLRVGPYADARSGGNKTVTLSGLKLAGSGVHNYSLAGTHAFPRAEITAKPRPVLNADFTVAIPRATYDGQPHGAAVAAAEGVAGLGAATVAYARQRADGTYEDPAAGEPVNAGTYRVTVSFAEGSGFAAMEGPNAIDAGILTIQKASASAAATITVPIAATERRIPLDALDLPEGMARGAKLKEAPGAAGAVLKKVTGEPGEAAFTLNTKAVKADQSQDFQLVLTSGNYVKLTVTVTVLAAASGLQITPPAATVKRALSEYGTPLKDILSLEGGSATLNGRRVPGAFTLPERPYDAGKYTDIEVLFNSKDGNYQDFPVKVPAAFTIEKALVTSLDSDVPPAQYIMIYANDASNFSAEGLKDLVSRRTGTYTARYANGTVELKPVWRAAGAAKPYQFDPKGKAENIWYPYTATLTTAKDSDAKNFRLRLDSPAAYVRVIPVKATRTLVPSSAALTAAALKGLTNENLAAALGLPEKAVAAYEPMEDIPSSAFEETSGESAISGWRMNGKPLTLKALRAAASSGRDVTVTLTPVCAAVPAWATVVNAPAFKLTITGKAA